MADVDRPIVQLAPVELAPPGGGGSKAPPLSLRAALSVALLVGVFVLAALVLLAGVGLNLLLFQAGRVNFGLVLGTLAIVAALGRAVLAAVKAPPEPRDEVQVPSADEPILHDEISALAAQVGTRPPDRVVLIPTVNAYVREFGPMLGLVGGTRTLAIGTPLLDTLTVSQLRAVLAHELGHLAGGDTRLGPLAYRTEQVLANLVGRLGNAGAGRLFVAYWKLQHRLSSKVRRGQELVADRAAVKVAGRQASADALRTVEATAFGQEVLNQVYLGPLIESGHRPTELREGFRLVLSSRWNDIKAHLEEPDGPSDPYASHPPTAQRVARVADLLETHVGGTDDRAARVLLRDPDRWIAAVDDVWLDLVTSHRPSLPKVEWSEWPELVVAREQAGRSVIVNQALAGLGLPAGLEGVSAAFDQARERDLAAALIRAGWRTGGPDERAVVLRVAIESTASTAAVRHGFSWQHSWSGAVALRSPSGATVELSEMAKYAADGNWVPLRSELEINESAPQTASAPVSDGARADVQTRDRTPPPQPPFSLIEPDVWEARLPGAIGRKVNLRIAPDGLTLNGTRIGYDELEHVAVGLGAEASSGISATITLTNHSGQTVKARMSAASAKGGQPIADTIDYLWRLVRSATGQRLSGALTARIANGEAVTVGDVILDRNGMRHAKKRSAPLLAWSSVADPRIEGRNVVIPGVGIKGIVVPLGAMDTFLLFEAVPELRALFGD